jgi:hypothetical protein
LPQSFSQIRIARETQPSIAIRTKVLGGIEGKAADHAKCAGGTVIMQSSDGLGTVFDNVQ